MLHNCFVLTLELTGNVPVHTRYLCLMQVMCTSVRHREKGGNKERGRKGKQKKHNG